MSRRNNIRWKNSDEKELSRVVRNYNSKINRILKKDPNMKDFLPERVSKKELKENIKTRRDLNRELNSLKRFTTRGSEELITNENGLTITKYLKKEVEIKVATINRLKSLRRKELNELEVSSRGKDVGYKNMETGRIDRMQLLQPKVFNFKKKSKRDFEHFVKGLSDVEQFITMKDIILRENYLDSLYEHLGKNVYTDMIRDKIMDIPLDDFISTYYRDKEATISFIYDLTQATDKLEILLNDVWNVQNEKIEIEETDGILDNLSSNTYAVYDKNGRIIKKLGTKRAVDRFMDKNYNAVEFKLL